MKVEMMTWRQLRALWDERDARYESCAHPETKPGHAPRRGWKPSRESVEAARAYRASEARAITDKADRRRALAVLATWDVAA